MLLWNGWRWMRGIVYFQAEGGLCERFLSLLNEAEPPVALWNVHRKQGAVTAGCRAADYKRVRSPARRTGTRVHAVRKSGLPFATRPFLRRSGLFVGAALAMIIYMLLSTRIWIIDIQVEDPTLAARIEAHLADCGVTVGTRTRDVDIASVRMQAIAEIKEINQLSLYFDGSVAHVGVQLQKESASPPDRSPANVLAARDGRIVSMQTTIGQPLVQTGEAVIKGDLLVCGAVETEKGTLLRHAEAVVLAETTHVFEECITKTEHLPQQGRVIEQPSLRLLGWTVPLYSQATFDETWSVRSERRLLSLFGTALPVGIESNVYTEHIEQPVTHTKAEAEQLAHTRLQARADETLGDATVTDSRFEGMWDGDTYRLRATFNCIEDIAVQVPLSIASS